MHAATIRLSFESRRSSRVARGSLRSGPSGPTECRSRNGRRQRPLASAVTVTCAPSAWSLASAKPPCSATKPWRENLSPGCLPPLPCETDQSGFHLFVTRNHAPTMKVR